MEGEDEKRVFKRTLLEAGFNLQSVTSYSYDPEGVVYFFVYDIRFSIVDERIIHLTKSTIKGFDLAGLTG
ncbi:MAG: hypothetical protein ACO306_04350 [Flavobacteriaceae bacterium]